MLGFRVKRIDTRHTRKRMGQMVWEQPCHHHWDAYAVRCRAVNSYAGAASERLFLQRAGKLSLKRDLMLLATASGDRRLVYEDSIGLFGKINDRWMRLCEACRFWMPSDRRNLPVARSKLSLLSLPEGA